LVDPLALDNSELDFIGEVLANSGVEKVLHAAEYDVMTLRRDFGFTFANLFDTMIAARILGWERVGLGALLEDHFGITLDKRHQRANWGKRPLRSDMIRYAQMDTHYLLALSDVIRARLGEGNHLEEGRELFDEVALAEWSGSEFDPQGFWRLNGATTLKPRELAVLEAVYLYQEDEARNRDLPVFKVLPDHALIALATAKPRTTEELERVQGMTDGLIRQFGDHLLRAIEQGMEATPPSRPRMRAQSDEIVHKRYEVLHAWRKERAAKRGVSSEVVMPRDALWELAEVVPRTQAELERIKTIGPWRAKTYGDELLKLLASLAE
jgi:ribonuclease D